MLATSMRRFIPLVAVLLFIGYFVYTYDDQIWSLPRFGKNLNLSGTASATNPNPKHGTVSSSSGSGSGKLQPTSGSKKPKPKPSKGDSKAEDKKPAPAPAPPKDKPNKTPPKQELSAPPFSDPTDPNKGVYREVFSVSRPKGKYFEIDFPGYRVFNPNILPHPAKAETWIVVAQKERGTDDDDWEAIELVCEAGFKTDKDSGTDIDILGCATTPTVLPVKLTEGGHCYGELEWFNGVGGPHDARVFYGPKVPYIMYGSRSGYTCFGQWIQDFRGLIAQDSEKGSSSKSERGSEKRDDGGGDANANANGDANGDGNDNGNANANTKTTSTSTSSSTLFATGTELHRPGPFGEFEKNWFIFWDKHGQMYGHYDVAPRRSFAKLDYDGSVIGDDLASLATSDETCMAKYMPRVFKGEAESDGHNDNDNDNNNDQGSGSGIDTPKITKSSLHQATNSLSITLCNRSDPKCIPSDDNTFIMTIFQQKFYYPHHSMYRPYAMLFRPAAPFAVYAISQKPVWFHGHRQKKTGKNGQRSVVRDEHQAGKRNEHQAEERNAKADAKGDAKAKQRPDEAEAMLEHQSEMFFVTSIAWKTRGQTYHGYLDDVMFVAFGIEDNRAGAIDARAGDLLQDLGICGT